MYAMLGDIAELKVRPTVDKPLPEEARHGVF
jgi:hypothetical protein